MMRGLVYHSKSAIAHKMNYCLIATLDTMGRADAYDAALNQIQGFFRERNYQRTFDGRPLLFLYYLDGLLSGYWKGSLPNLKQSVDALRVKSRAIGDQNPFIVLLHEPPSAAELIRSQIGADAISTYGLSFGPNKSAAYSDLAGYVERYWQDEAQQTAAAVVPTVMIGWDSRPRKENPPAYDKRDFSRISKSAHIDIATPREFAVACSEATKFMTAHPSQCPYRVALIYSWNEYSEGGGLGPTLGDPTASVLRAANEAFKSCTN
jgi:hypothetical protein